MRYNTTKSTHDSEGFRADLYLSRDVLSLNQSKQWEVDYHSPKLACVLNKKKNKWKTAKLRPVFQATVHAKIPTQLGLDFSLESSFRFLAEQWRDATEHMSNFNKMVNYPAYQQIIGMGKVVPNEVLPLILRELKQSPDHWFWALREITKQDPAKSEDTFEGALESWLNWGKKEGYLT
ncbi:MAG: hypothetical protein ACR2LC_03630 [Pyrinomonadaceae bacterium]